MQSLALPRCRAGTDSPVLCMIAMVKSEAGTIAGTRARQTTVTPFTQRTKNTLARAQFSMGRRRRHGGDSENMKLSLVCGGPALPESRILLDLSASSLFQRLSDGFAV